MSRSAGDPDRRSGDDRRADDGAQRQLDEHRRLLKFGLYSLGALFFILLIVGATAFLKIEHERNSRVDAVTSILNFGCSTDNSQDGLLADLLEISVRGGGTFGANIAASSLSQFERRVLAAIDHVQGLANDYPPSAEQRVFQRTLHDLRDFADCSALADAYRNGDPLPPPEPSNPEQTTPSALTPDRATDGKP